MNSNTEKNIGAPSHPSNYNDLVPEWLGKFGNRFDLGIAIFSADNKVVYKTKKFLEHCALTEIVTSNSDQIDDWLRYMAERGDLSNDDPREMVDYILNQFHSQENDSFMLADIIPPSGRVIELKRLPSTLQFVTIFTEDVTTSRRNQETLDLAFEMGKSGYFYHNVETGENIVESSYMASILTVNEMQAVKEQGFWPLMKPEESEKTWSIWKDSVLNGKELIQTIDISSELSGIVTLKFAIRPIKSPSGKLNRLIGFFEDVTDVLKIQSELETAKTQSEESLKLKTQFLARISHEIRTPMNAVIGIADALIHHNRNPDIVPKLELIQSSAGSILNILDDTLNHSKMDMNEFAIELKPGDPSKVIKNVCALWETKAAANGVTIKCHIESSVPPELMFDKYRYEQCLNNLLSNAIKFSSGGNIDVICTRVDRGGNPSLIVAVKDNGIGMTTDQKARIFTPFQQGDDTISRRFGGTGLGMNITKNLIERMGGTISVKSEIGKGSIFVLSMPIAKESIDEKTASEALFDSIMSDSNRPETPYERLKILVADDNPTNHMVVKSLLHGVVAEVYTANHGQDVLDIMDVQDIDIILMDIHMPVMDGIEATLAIRSSPKIWSDVLIIAVTADPQYQQQRLCLNIGMDFAVAKPIKLVDILEAFDHVLALSGDQEAIAESA